MTGAELRAYRREMMYNLDDATRRWALQLANNPQSALTKAERERFRLLATADKGNAAQADDLRRTAHSLQYGAHLAYLDGRVAQAKKMNKRADSMKRLAEKVFRSKATA